MFFFIIRFFYGNYFLFYYSFFLIEYLIYFVIILFVCFLVCICFFFKLELGIILYIMNCENLINSRCLMRIYGRDERIVSDIEKN